METMDVSHRETWTTRHSGARGRAQNSSAPSVEDHLVAAGAQAHQQPVQQLELGAEADLGGQGVARQL